MTERVHQCLICQEEDLTQIILHCGHNFCPICVSYMVLKNRANGSPSNQVVCSKCGQTSRLDKDSIHLIQETIENKLIPQLDGTPQRLMSQKGIPLSKNMTSVQSFQYQQTPSTNVNHKHNIRRSMRQFCRTHALEQVSFVCMTCSHHPLCLKCILSKEHADHEVKSFNKAVGIMLQQLDLMQFQVAEGIELIEFKKRTAKDRNNLIQECWEKSKKSIEETFEQLVAVIAKKEAETLERCDRCYVELNMAVESEMEELGRSLEVLRKTKQKLKNLENQEEGYFDFLELYNSCKEESELIEKIPIHNHIPLDLSMTLKESSIINTLNSIGNLDLQVTNIRQQLRTEICQSQVDVNFQNCKPKKPPRMSEPPKVQNKLPQYASKFLQKYSHHTLKEQYHSISKNTFDAKSRIQKSRLQASQSSSNLHRKKSPLDRLKSQKQLYEHKKSKQF